MAVPTTFNSGRLFPELWKTPVDFAFNFSKDFEIVLRTNTLHPNDLSMSANPFTEPASGCII